MNMQDGGGRKRGFAGKTDGPAQESPKDERTRGNEGRTYKERLRRVLEDYAVIARGESTGRVVRDEKTQDDGPEHPEPRHSLATLLATFECECSYYKVSQPTFGAVNPYFR